MSAESAARLEPVTTLQGDAPAIAVRGLGHTYRRVDGPVLEGIDFDIAPGSIVALIGRSGSGKSTLLHNLAGLIQPSVGAVEIGGCRVEGPSSRWVMMFQAPSLFPWMSVAENAALGLRFSGRANKAKLRVPAVLEMVDLLPYADRNVQDISGGQQQRVALARSLAPEPDILLLDEPFSALDAFTRLALQRDVRRIAQSLRLTIVLVTHDVAEAALMADRAIYLASGPGRIAADTEIALTEQQRNEAAPGFRDELTRLNALYAEVAGITTGERE